MLYKEIQSLSKNSIIKKFKKGDLIYSQDEVPENIYIIKTGLVGLFHNSENGKEVFLRVFSEGSLFGHRSYFAKSPYHANTVALSNSVVMIIPHEECSRICELRPDLLMQVVQGLASDLGHAELRLAGLQDKSVARRVCEALVFLKLKYPEQVWKRKEIADFSVTTFESVARVMTQLSEAHIITKDGRDFIINDVEKLLSFNT